VDVRSEHYNLAKWYDIIESALDDPDSGPIVNIADEAASEYDAIFVGGGAGGRFGAAFLRALGGRPLIIDAWPFLGGSCPHQACVPHHLFSDVAAEMDLWRWYSGRFFFPDWDPGKASILEMVQLFRDGRSYAHAFMNWQTKEQLNVEFMLNARARIIDSRTVEAGGRRFTGQNMVIGTGAHVKVPQIPGLKIHGVYDFATLIEDLDYEPRKCVVIGGGKTAVEYGSFFNATGCETTIVTRSGIMQTPSLHHVDDDVRDYVTEGMRKRGITILEGAEPVEVRGSGTVSEVVVRLRSGETVTLGTDFVFVGTGEAPNTGWVLDALPGLKSDDAGAIIVDRRMLTSMPNVYAIGDAIGAPMEMFKARKCGVTAARNIMGIDSEFDFSEYPDFLHSTYEVTWVGLSEQEARQQYDDVIIIQMPPYVKGLDTEHLPLPLAERTMLYGFTQPELSGFQKLVADGRSRRVLGAHHVGYGAKDSFQYLDYLIHRPQGLTIDELGDMNELFLNPEHFIQLSRLRAGNTKLVDL
jgi:dihydrolipoamide dehydrogenase